MGCWCHQVWWADGASVDVVIWGPQQEGSRQMTSSESESEWEREVVGESVREWGREMEMMGWRWRICDTFIQSPFSVSRCRWQVSQRYLIPPPTLPIYSTGISVSGVSVVSNIVRDLTVLHTFITTNTGIHYRHPNGHSLSVVIVTIALVILATTDIQTAKRSLSVPLYVP